MIFRKGVWAIFLVFAVYAALYFNHVIAAGMPLIAQLSYFVGSSAAICMAIGVILAARPRVSEMSFGGLDKMYTVHKYLGVAALLLFLTHFATVPGGEDEEVEAASAVAHSTAVSAVPAENAPVADASAEGATAQTAPAVSVEAAPAAPVEAAPVERAIAVDLLGVIAMIGIILLLFITLNRKFAYHRWYITHRLMGLFYAVVAVHIYLALEQGEAIPLFSAPSAFLLLLVLIGLVAYIYKQFFYRKIEKHRFSLAALNRLERATEVVLEPKKQMFPFEAGQFAFITINAAGFKEPHPFTISSGAKEDRLRFTIKALGDYTRRVQQELTTGGDVDIEGPYGKFNPLNGRDKQVWVAGGIGITPFLSAMRSMEPGHGKTILFYYCVRTADEALFFDELKERAAQVGGVTISRLDSDKGERIDANAIKADIGSGMGDWEFYFCGPKPMTAAVCEGLSNLGVSKRRFHKEEFEFR